MGVNSFFLEERNARLRFRALGDASRRLAPVVKNLRDVPDPWRLFAQAKHELEVLHAVEGRIEPRFQGEFSTNAEKMADVHRSAKIFRRPIRLKERLYQP